MINDFAYSDLAWIKKVMKEIKESYGYVSKVNSSYKVEKVRETLEAELKNGEPYVFFTRYDSNDKFDAQDNLIKELPLNWRGNGKVIVKTFESAGFKVSWGGKEDDLIFVISTPKTNEVADLFLKSRGIIEYSRNLYNFGSKVLLVIAYKRELREPQTQLETFLMNLSEVEDFGIERAKLIAVGELRTTRNLIADPVSYARGYASLALAPEPIAKLLNKYTVSLSYPLEGGKSISQVVKTIKAAKDISAELLDEKNCTITLNSKE